MPKQAPVQDNRSVARGVVATGAGLGVFKAGINLRFPFIAAFGGLIAAAGFGEIMTSSFNGKQQMQKSLARIPAQNRKRVSRGGMSR